MLDIGAPMLSEGRTHRVVTRSNCVSARIKVYAEGR